MQNYNFINFIKIVDLSLLNFIDYASYTDSYSEEALMISNEYNQLQINLNPKARKLITSLILNNISNQIHYGKMNIIINTCKPMQNWRQYKRKAAIKSYKYVIQDESIAVDLIKLNQWLDKLYTKLPTINVKNFNTEFLNITKLNNINTYNNIKYVEFNELDVWDAYRLLSDFLKYNGNLAFDKLNYNIISDGNREYAHDSNFTDEIKENIRLQLIEKGII